MVFKHKPKTEIFKIPSLKDEGAGNVWFGDILGSHDENTPNPITGSWFRIENGANNSSATPPKYYYDEVGVVIEGEITLKDQQTGQQQTLHPGDTFMIQRGSVIEFSTQYYGVAWKCGSRAMAKL